MLVVLFRGKGIYSSPSESNFYLQFNIQRNKTQQYFSKPLTVVLRLFMGRMDEEQDALE